MIANYKFPRGVDLVDKIVNQIAEKEHQINEMICKKLLNTFGYPNDIELHVSHDHSLKIWLHNGIEVGRMQCHRNIPKFEIEWYVI